ncbi:MAG: M1 family metallopeptidase [Rhodothermales bacterium]|nr:M1 family metallopeptidase [Rhodothermales bacterium]
MIRIARVFYCTVCVIVLFAFSESRADDTVDITHYAFDITLSDDSDRVEVAAAIHLIVLQSTSSVTLDLVGTGADGKGMAISSVSVDGLNTSFMHSDDRVTIDLVAPASPGDEVLVEIAYSGIPRDGLIISRNKHGDRTFFGDNWPNRARNWLSVVDKPADKATVAFAVTAPDHYQVVANGRLREESHNADGSRLTRWESGVPLATKVMVIGVARFAVDHVGVFHSVPLQSWVYPQERDKGFYDYRMAWPILDYFVDKIGPFPYEKLANVQSKTIYGGMENAGSIFYHENSIDGRRGSETLFAHEIAHQWFGDSVTEQHFHHVWLSEGFATYFTNLYMEHMYGTARMNERLTSSRQSISNYADANPDSPVVDTSITVLTNLLSTNTYQKGGWVLHMLRREIGDETFWEGIRNYYAKHRDSNALTSDFAAVMEDVSGVDLAWFFDQWIFTPSIPALDVSWSYNELERRVIVDARQSHIGRYVYQLPVQLRFDNPDGSQSEVHQFRMSAGSGRYTFPADVKPERVVVDPDVNLLARISVTPPTQ